MAEGAMETSIHEAAREGNVEAVRQFLSADLDARNARDRLSRAPLHLAAWAGQAEVVRLLCDASADVGAAAMDDMAAIHFACQKGHTEVVRILLASGAYVNARNRKGMTALHFAVQGKREDLTQLLIKKGANLSTENKAGKTPIDLVRDESFKTLIRQAEQERNARRSKNKENEKLSSGRDEVAGTQREGEEAEEGRPITVPERPTEPQSRGEEEADAVGPISVPERPNCTVPETQVVNGKSHSGEVEKKNIGVEAISRNEGHQSMEPKRKKAKVSLLSFGDDNEDEIE
ncbi:unnamed protein product [Calypogeia fissa]